MTGRYVTNPEYRRQKSALTRASNSGDPLRVLAAVERALEEWTDKAWPDDWSRWHRALEDSFSKLRRSDVGDVALPGETLERYQRAGETLERGW